MLFSFLHPTGAVKTAKSIRCLIVCSSFISRGIPLEHPCRNGETHSHRARERGSSGGTPNDASARVRVATTTTMMEEPAPLINPTPVVHRKRTSARSAAFQKSRAHAEEDEGTRDPFDAEEVFEHIKDINDPEHPYSLEQVSGGGDALVRDGQHARCFVTHVLCVCAWVCV